ncbi:MAG: ribulose-phosphate 3-epimerase [Deltaproteobacteria bacterium]|nr:MAG: ribulose-phosphate 3-epimerase [Deltaproteobacteria bacterium]
MTKLIAPSILSANFSKLGKEIRDVEKHGADWIHIDVMDGQFVPNITYGTKIVKTCNEITKLPLDVHLMIEKPENHIDEFAKSGADFISVHSEACPHLHRVIQQIKENNAAPGVALNPSTPLSAIEWVLNDLDFVLIMSVNPGFGGQKFIKESLSKIAELKKMIKNRNLDLKIQVDGGINIDTIKDVNDAGADIFVAGSAIFKKEDYGKAISDLRAPIM